nr:Tox-REase-5 domain-containing protein [Corallococcus praedator]
MVLTGCASLPPAPARSLGHAVREASAPALTTSPGDGASRASAPLSRFVTDPVASARLHRRGGMTGANPVRTTGGPRGSPQADVWEKLLTAAGLEERDARPIPGGALTSTQATRLLSVFLGKPVTLGTFPARMAVGHVLREVLEQGEVSRDTLLRRVERFRRVAVLRPDGHLAWVWTGRTQQKAGALKWKDGTFRAGPFELGRFYVSNGFVIELADEQLEPVHGPVFVEVYDDADLISRTLDGAEAAVVKLALALGQFLTAPRDSIAALKDLPAGVVALLASSPEYFERFRYMTRGEQVQAVAELTTSLLVTKGTATSATRTVTGALAGAEATVPVLSLSAQGALTLERIAVPVGRAASVLGGGPGAAIVLQRANTATPPPGPGKWGPAEESMSARSRRYQEQISGHSADEAYWVGGVGKNSGGVKFDGFVDGVLREAKGPGYAKFFEGLEPKEWFKNSGAQGLIDQARRQAEKVRGMGISVRWHVAEKSAVDAFRELFKRARVEGVEILHTPAL